MVKVSAIVPVYNASKYIRECLESLLYQSFDDIEIICVNDGSVDNSSEILNEYANLDKRIKIINNIENVGVTKSRNIGLDASLGKYIFFIDSDDWIGLDFIRELYEVACDFNVDAVFGAMTLVWEGRSVKKLNRINEGIYEGEEKLKSLQAIYDIEKKEQLLKWSVWGNLFKKEKYYKYQIKVDERIKVGEDLAAILPFIIDSDRIYITNITSYYYRQHENSTMHSKRSKSMDYYYLWEYLKPYLENKPMIRQQVAHICCTGIENDYVNILNLSMQNFYMFPYELIPIHSKIIIFGAGLVGKSYYRQLMVNQYCKIELMVDNNYNKNFDGRYPVISPEFIKDSVYDYILVAVLNEEQSKKIYNQLLYICNVPNEKIVTYIPRMMVDYIDFGE